jgi:hypothetical protein
MNLLDAIKLLETTNFDKHGYSNTIIESKSLRKHLINSKYGICQCGYDWPFPYNPKVEDFMATDWQIYVRNEW